jgi:hypothetical protein
MPRRRHARQRFGGVSIQVAHGARACHPATGWSIEG